MIRRTIRKVRTDLACAVLAWVVGVVLPVPALAIFASPLHAGCYVVSPGQCSFHLEPFTIELSGGTKLVSFRVVALAQNSGTQTTIWGFAPDQSNPVPFLGSTFTPSLVTQDFAATCGTSYTISLQGQDTGDAGLFNLGQTGVINCPSGAGGLVWIPAAVTGAATDITVSGVTLHATVDPQGGDTNVHFEYGPTIDYGSEVLPVESLLTGTGPTHVSASVLGLSPISGYHFRIVATNSAGTVRGADHQFSTILAAPLVATGSATDISASGATLHGTVDPQGDTTEVSFEYGLTTAYGSIAIPAHNQFAGVGPNDVSVTVNGLTPNGAYHFRLIATNSVGTTLGADQPFTALDWAKRFVRGKALILKGSALPARRRGIIVLGAPGLNAGLDPLLGGIELHLTGDQPISSEIWTMPTAGWRKTKHGAKYLDKAHVYGPIAQAVLNKNTLIVRAAGASIQFPLPPVGAREVVAIAAVFPGAVTAVCAEFQPKNKRGRLIGSKALPPVTCGAL